MDGDRDTTQQDDAATFDDDVLASISRELRHAAAGRGSGPVFHYTTAEGALGIIDSSSIWATDVRFLNDSSEWEYAVGLAELVLAADVAECHESWGDLRTEFDRLSEMTTYVACFSAERNQLSQWRGYSGQGYALGLSVPYLSTLASRLPSTTVFSPVVYDPTRQRRALASALRKLLVRDPETSDHPGWGNRDLFYGALSVAAAFFKHPDFVEEAEWRLAMLPQEVAGENTTATSFRTLRSAIVPYRVIPLDRSTQKTGNAATDFLTSIYDPRLTEVIVGPGPDQAMAAAGVAKLLASRHFGGVEVSQSTTPFRG